MMQTSPSIHTRFFRKIIALLRPQYPQTTDLTPGYIWTEPVTGIEFVWIPPGSFEMGGYGDKDEQPLHTVTLQGFWLSKYNITQQQYLQIMGNNPSKVLGRFHPVEQINWNDACEFTTKASSLTGMSIRLPSEAEWEYACRAGSQQALLDSEVATLAYFMDNSGRFTKPVGQLTPNAWGLHDMLGNVWEWTQDCYTDSYHRTPTDGSAWELSDNSRRVIRGGSWASDLSSIRIAIRRYSDVTTQSGSIGFRVAMSKP